MIIKDIIVHRYFNIEGLTEKEFRAIMFSLIECRDREIHNAYYTAIIKEIIPIFANHFDNLKGIS